MKEALGRLENENQKLTNALQSAMEDNAHMSEKLLLSEQAQESLKVRVGDVPACWVARPLLCYRISLIYLC
jgi:hypothetical protein